MYHPETNEQITRLTARIAHLENTMNGLWERIMYLEQNTSRPSVNSSKGATTQGTKEDYE